MAGKCVKVPVVMQMEALECGAACLTMVLAYYGKWVPLEQIREACGVSRDGTNAKNILIAARSYGLFAKAYRYSTEKVKATVFPLIIHWNFTHYVVLDGFKGNMAVINDPAKGMVKVTMEEFEKSYTGVCLKLAPEEGFVKGGKQVSVADFVKKRLKGTLWPFIFVIVTGIITSYAGVMLPLFSQVYLDEILSGVHRDWFIGFALLLLAMVLTQMIVSAMNAIYLLKIRGKLSITANVSFLWHILHLPLEFFSQRSIGDLVSRQGSNEKISETLITRLAPVILNFGLIVVYLVFMLNYHVGLTFIGISAGIVNIAVADRISKRRLNISRALVRNNAQLSATTLSGIELMETIKSSGAEYGFFQKWSGFQANVNEQKVRSAKLDRYLGMVPELMISVVNLVILLLGVVLIMDGEFTMGMLLAFQGFLSSFFKPFNSLIGVMQSMQEIRSSMERIEDVMNYDISCIYQEEYPRRAVTERLKGEICIRSLTFGYYRLGTPLFTDFSLTIQKGSHVAIVGGSGCGKSTIAKLLAGLYTPWSGDILYDGMPLLEIPREIFTESVAVADQEIVIFEDSVEDNITLWDTTIAAETVIEASKAAGIHDDIVQRDGDYRHKLLEGGRNFSGGQRQRIEIARMLAQSPAVAIMDEATSALDANTEYEVMTTMKKMGITCIFIAHRLSTIRSCDEIIVLEQGKIVERGTHEQLYQAGGMYRDLIAME